MNSTTRLKNALSGELPEVASDLGLAGKRNKDAHRAYDDPDVEGELPSRAAALLRRDTIKPVRRKLGDEAKKAKRAAKRLAGDFEDGFREGVLDPLAQFEEYHTERMAQLGGSTEEQCPPEGWVEALEQEEARPINKWASLQQTSLEAEAAIVDSTMTPDSVVLESESPAAGDGAQPATAEGQPTRREKFVRPCKSRSTNGGRRR